MNDLFERAGYLKGLLESMTDTDEKTKHFLSETTLLLSEMAGRLSETQNMLADLNDYLEQIDDDLEVLENERGDALFDDDEDDGFFAMEDDVEDTPSVHRRGDITVFPGTAAVDADDDDEDADEDDDADVCAPETEILACPVCHRLFRMHTFARCICPVCNEEITPVRIDVDELPFASKSED